MKYEWYDELNFVRDHLAPRMSGTGVKLLSFDHNWDLDWYPRAVMNEGQAYYAGSAWHCSAATPVRWATCTAPFRNKDIRPEPSPFPSSTDGQTGGPLTGCPRAWSDIFNVQKGGFMVQ